MKLFYREIDKKGWIKRDRRQIENLNKETQKNLINNLMLKCIVDI